MEPQNNRQQRGVRLKRKLLVIGLLLLVLVPVASAPRVANAFPGEAMAAAVWSYIKSKVTTAISVARKTAGDLAFKNALKVYLTKLAEDTAIWLASAGTGQKPLFVTDPHYFTDLGDAAAGEFLDTLATSTFGIDVCQSADLRTQFSIESAVRSLIDPANWCQNQVGREQSAALTTDTFIVGGEPVMSDIIVSLPTAEQNLLALQNADVACDDFKVCENDVTKNCQSAADCSGGAACVAVQTTLPITDVRCPEAIAAMAGATCMPRDGMSGIFSLQYCADAYARDIDNYRAIVDENHSLGMNLCSARRRVARCTASTIFADAEATGRQPTNLEFIPQFTLYFEPGENDIGQIMTLAEKAKEEQAKKLEEDAAGDKTCLPIKDPVTGEIKTPSTLTCAAADKLADDPSGSVFGIYTGSPVADAIGVFTNTLTKKLLERIFKKGFNPSADPGSARFAGGQLISGSGSGGVAAARSLFASIAQPQITQGGPYDVLNELTACPSTNPAPNNCTITEKFRSAIEQPMSVREAIDRGILDGNLLFGFDANGLQPEYNQGLPYRSLIILRLNRVIPVGWELAAEYIRDFGRGNFTLNDVIAGYEQCSGATISPFCGLVDPDWVLKAPEAFCAKQGFGETITNQQWIDHDGLPETPKISGLARQEICVDRQSCISENSDGSCNGFGNCIEEKPIWRFSGQSCDAHFASCETFMDVNGSEASFLENTVDTATCTADNAGCRWYCNEKDTSGAYSCTETSGEKKYFTGAVQTCPGDAAGCTEFIKTTDGTNLTANGSFETRGDDDGVDDGIADTFPGWFGNDVTLEASSEARSGGAGLRLTGLGGSLTSSFDTQRALNGESFTATLYGKSTLGCGGTFGVRTNSGGVPYLASQVITLASGWQRYVVTLTFDAGLTYDSTAVTTFFTPDIDCIADIDDVQLETGTAFSVYKEYGAVNTTHLKVGSGIAAPLANDSFESFVGTADDGTADTFDGWTTNHGSIREKLEATSTSTEGSAALRLTVTPGEQFDGVVSDLAPVTPGTERIYTQSVWIYVPTDVTLAGTWILDRHALIGDTCTSGTCHHYTSLGSDSTWTNDSIPHGEWVRKWYKFKTEADVSNLRGFVSVGSEDGSGSGTVLVDRYSFEEESADIFCSADEVGCALYTSSSDAIPGIATAADVCAADDVGCRAFLEMPVTDNGADATYKDRTGYRCSDNQAVSCSPDGTECSDEGIGTCLPSVSLTPSTGERCSVANVGCEEYTNLDEVARGGEGREYYTRIRACETPPDDQKTFYTWIGSESTGFQLQAYNLSQAADGSPAYVAGTDATLCTVDIFNDPEDTRWSPDCRQFYDADLSVYYRLYSKTITVSEDCHPLRNSLDGVTYDSIPSESVTCPASAVQCREYRGPSGFNSRIIVNDNFNDGDTVGWDGGTWSTRTLSLGGGSMAVDNPPTNPVATNSDLAVPSQLTEGKTYILSFWAGATTSTESTITARFDGGAAAFAGTATARFNASTGEPEWNFYRLGPVTLDRAPDTSIEDGDGVDNLVIDGTAPYVLDTLKLIEVTENSYLIKNSYTICTGSENCDRYSRSDGTTHTLKSFTRLCSQEVIGCQAVIKTQNSDSPFSQSFEGGTGTVTVLEDEVQFVINTPEHACQSEYQGCTELGSPVLTRDGVTQYNPVTLIDDPDTYATTLCSDTENGCSAFTNKRTGGEAYFKNPDPYTCEYKTVTVAGTQTTGWYKTGTSGLSIADRCPVTYPPPEGQPEGSPASGQGWVGLCPSQQAGCTEYLDAVEPTGTTIVIDGGFESGTSFADGGWNRNYCTSEDIGCLRRTTGDVTDVVHGGGTALHLVSADAGTHGGIYENISLDNFTPGAEYDLSGWIRTQSGGALRVGPGYVEFHHRVGETFTFRSAHSLAWYTAPTGLSEWTRFQLHFTVPKDTDVNSVRVWPVQMLNAGEIWLDDVIVAPSLASYALEQDVDASSCGGVVDDAAGCHAFSVPENGTNTIDVDTRQSSSLTCPDVDGTCDGNMILQVRRDRICSEWLACKTSMEVTVPQTGQIENVCLEVAKCVRQGENGQCAQYVVETPTNQTFDTPGDVSEIQNLSGMSKVGARWADGTIEGFYPISAMPEVGVGGSGGELVPNGNFELDNTGFSTVGVDCNDITPGSWTSRVENPGAVVTIDEDGDEGCIGDGVVTFDKLDENNILFVAPDGAWTGAHADIDSDLLDVGQEYVITFRARYDATPNPDDRIRVEIGLNDDSGPYPLFGDITATTGWQNFTLGPITLSTGVGGENSSLNFIRTVASQDTAFFIDDVSMKPVLEVQSAPTYVARSCRSYATEEATSCTYVDENNARHDGWYGYCLERDPDNARQCLSWWPVDLISGEPSPFGTFTDSSYSGRRPLFYCLETEGVYETDGFVVNGADNASFSGSGPNPNIQGFRKPVKTSFARYRNDDDPEAHCSNHSFLTGCNGQQSGKICSNDMRRPCETSSDCSSPGTCVDWTKTCTTNAAQSCTTDSNCPSGGSCVNSPGLEQGPDSCLGFSFCGETDPGIDGTEVNVVAASDDAQYHEYEIERIVWANQRTTDSDWGDSWQEEANPQNDWTVSCGPDDGHCIDSGEGSSNYFNIKVNFDPSSRELESYTVNMFDGSESSGGSWVSGIIYLREMCRAIVQVADGENATPWQDRIEGGYTVEDDLGYTLTTDFAPFGGLVAPSGPCGLGTIDPYDPTTWDSDCRTGYDDKEPLEVLKVNSGNNPPRSGSPYSCVDVSDGNCDAGTMCRGGTNDGKTCNSFGEIADCYGAAIPGVCVGMSSDIPVDRVVNGLPLMRRLWAKSIRGWHWMFPGAAYEDLTATPPPGDAYVWDVPSSRCSGNPSTRPAYPNDLCAVPPTITNIKIGAFPRGVASGDVHVGAGGTITMYFNSNANPEQEPITNLKIDWGDGAIDNIPWNHASKTDPNQPHVFSHGYTDRGTYHPSIQLGDNWGWCGSSVPNQPTSPGDECDADGSWFVYDNGSHGVIVD